MSSTTVYPNGDGSIGGWGIFGGGTSNIYTVIDEGTASPNDSDYIAGPFGAGNYFIMLGDMPGDFGTATAVSFKIRAQYSTAKGDNKSFDCRLYKSDESTAITANTNTSVSGSFSTYTISPSITGATDKTSWDGARLRVSPQSGSSNGSIFISAVQVEITYTAASGGLFTMSFLEGLAPCGPKNFNRLERCIPQLWIPRRPQILVPAMVVSA